MPIIQNYSNFLTNFNSTKFKALWPAQEYILHEYSDKYSNESDVAIELPTGAGKTLISLLIAEAWRAEGNKVAVLSANKTLAKQMVNEANTLGIPNILMEGRGISIPTTDRRDYSRGNKTAIMNYWVYFNQNPVVDNADLLIMDDAHLAEHCFHSLWSVKIDRNIHRDLFISIVSELRNYFPEYVVLHDALDDNIVSSSPPELLSFIDQCTISNRLREIVDTSDSIKKDDSLRFRWTHMRRLLNETNIYLSTNSIWIRPYIYPLISNEQYSSSRQRLYMSATIGDASDLCRRLGVRKIVKIPVPTNIADRTSGRRLIMMNRLEDEDIPERSQRAILSALKILTKSVWLCNSKSIAEKYRRMVLLWLGKKGFNNQDSWILSNLGDEIEEFKVASSGHLFVGGRFDGMDFQGNECRLVVITTLPKSINIQEEFLYAYLRDASFMRRRLNQRIIQALGRCNRFEADYAVYILADRRFATHLSREINRIGLSSNLKAEIDLAQNLAEKDVEDIDKYVKDFLSQDFDNFDQEIKSLQSGVPILNQSAEDDIAEKEVIAWSALFASQNYSVAASRFEDCWNIAFENNLRELCGFYGWCWAKARYLSHLQSEPGALENSLEILKKAIDRGGLSSWFNRLKSSIHRIEQRSDTLGMTNDEYINNIIYNFDELLEKLGNTGNRFEKWCNHVESGLISKSHAQFQTSAKELGTLLGFKTHIPKHNSSADCIWKGIFGNYRELFTIEVKVEHDVVNSITASDIGQVHNQIHRAREQYEKQGFTIRGIIASHISSIQPDADSAAGEIKIIQKEAIIELFRKIKTILSEYRSHWSYDDVTLRNNAAERIRGKLAQSGWLMKTLVENENRFINTDELMKEWK